MQSIQAIDVGFDPRLAGGGMLVAIADRHVRYDRPGTRGASAEVVGDVEMVAETLARAGYSVVVARTANGRDVQCTPPEMAPVGDRPGYEWRGPVWAIQARNDNYWCLGPSLMAAAERAGWRPDELRPLADPA